ncbi:MAG: transglutaminase [Flavobacteriaceae bacterium]
MKFLCTCLIVLTSLQPLFSQDFRFGKVSKEELSETRHPIYPESNAAVLYREIKTNFDYNQDDGFYVVTEVFERIKIYKKEGFDWGNVELYLYDESNRYKEDISSLKGYTYTLADNGKIEETKLGRSGIFEEKQTKYRKTYKFAMPALKEGCVIEYQYMMKSPLIGSIDTYRFQETIPVNKVYVDFRTPEYLNYKNHRRGWIFYDVKQDSRERSLDYTYTKSALDTDRAVATNERQTVKFKENIYQVELKDVEPIIEESYSGNLDNYTSSITFELEFTRFPNSPFKMYATNWEAVTKAIYESDAFGGQLSKEKYFEEDIDQLLTGISNQKEKAIKVFEFVKGKMNWNKYLGVYCDDGVKEAYKSGIGSTPEINLMLTAMLRHAGLKSNPILLSTKTNGIPIFPTRSGFNYVISSVELPEGLMLMDATNKNATPNVLDEELLNWQGVMIWESGASNWVPLQTNEKSQSAYICSAKINENLEVEGEIKAQFTGNRALEKRNTFKGLTTTEAINKFDFKNVQISNLEFSEIDNPYQPLKMVCNFVASDFVEEINDEYYISPMVFLALNENPFKLNDRKYPVEFGYAQLDRIIFTIEIPQGYQVKSIPENANFVVGENEYEFKYLLSQRGNLIQLMMNLGVNNASEAAENYQSLKEFYQTMVDKQKEKIVFSKL